MRHRLTRSSLMAACAVLIVTLAWPAADAVAQGYTRLQVLLPGETAAPGTGSGKLGVPSDQVVGEPFSITIRACDNNWNTVASITNTVLITSSDASATLPGPITLSAGTSTAQVTLNAAGTFTFSADDQSDPTIPLATSSSVQAFLLDGFEFSRINQKNQYAGQPMSISITAVDPTGNSVPYDGQVSLQQLTSFGIGRINPVVVTMSNGTWSGQVTNYRADETSINRGNVNIYAYLASNSAINGTSDPFTVHPGPFSRVQIVVPGQDPSPGSVSGVTGTPATQAAAQTFVVSVFSTDAYWNPVPSGDVVRITSSDPAASTPVTGSLSNGFRQFTVSLGTVGTQTLTVTDQTNGSIQGMTSAGIPVIASAADHFEIDPIAGPVTAGTNVNVTIRATDAGGNTIPDYSGNAVLIANTGPASISPETIVFANGVWTGAMVFRGAGGSVSFTCSDYSSPPHVGTSNSFQVLAGPLTKLQVLLPGQTPAGGTAIGFTGTPTVQSAGTSFTLRVRACDQYWNRVPGVNDRIGLSSSDAFATMPAETLLNNGEITLPVTLYKSGFQTITAVDLDQPSVASHTSSNVEVVGGPYSRIVLVAPGQSVAPGTPEGRSGNATDQSISFAFTCTVYATDQWFNPVGGPTDLIHLTSTDPLAQLASDTPMQDGVCQLIVRLATGGFQQITASNVTQPSMPTSTTQVRAISSGLHLEAEVSPTTVQAGEAFSLTVKVTNDAGAVIQEINTAVTVEVRNASTQAAGRGVLLNSQFQLLQGQRTMPETYTFAEPIVLVVRDEAGNTPAVTEPVNVLPGPPAEVKLSSNPKWVGGNKKAAVTARVVDQFDNGVPDQPVVFSLLSGLGTLTPIDSVTSQEGAALADFRSPRVQGVSHVRAESNGLSDELDIQTAFVAPNAASGYITNYPNPFHPGETKTTIAYKLRDHANVTMSVYTLTGSLVLEKRFVAGSPGGVAGLNEITWDGRNGKGELVASGGYVLHIEAVGNGETLHDMRRKIAVVR